MILEQANTFIYLGCNISQNETHVVTSKVSKFLQILGILNNVLNSSLGQR
jgi:hypothetical protein